MFEDIRAALSHRTLLEPQTNSPVNVERLPTWGRTELEVRERPTEAPTDRLVRLLLHATPVLAPIFVVALPLLIAISPKAYGIMSLVVLVGLRFLIWPRADFVRPDSLWMVLRVAAAALLSAGVVYIVADYTFIGLGVIATIFMVPAIGLVPVDIVRNYTGWLSADPRLPNDLALGRPSLDVPLLVVPLLLIAAALVLVLNRQAMDEVSLASLAVLVCIPFINLFLRPISMLALVNPYLFYNGRLTETPGVWRPLLTLPMRRWRFLAFLSAAFLWVAVALQLIAPSIDDGALTVVAFRTFNGAIDAINTVIAESVEEGVEIDRPVVIFGMINAFAFGNGCVAFALLYIATLPIRLRLARLGLRATAHRTQNGDWDMCAARVHASKQGYVDPIDGATFNENDHVFLGFETTVGFPVLLHKPLLKEHTYIVGDSGSGKTALGITPLLIQLLRDKTETPIVIFDLKGDPTLFHSVRIEAEQRRRDFRFFRPERGASTFHFDPIQNLASGSHSEMQICQLFLDALSLNHGEGYGRSYYSKRSRNLLLAAMEEAPRPTSLVELADRLQAYSLRPRESTDAFELLSTIEALARYPALDKAPPEHTIHMPTVLDERQVVYFWLPAAVESMSVREIGKLALFSLLSAAIQRQNDRAEHRQTYLVIDEFQRIAGENFKIILEQARSFGIGAILANQSMEDLRSPSADLRATISANTRTKMYFSVSQPNDIETLAKAFGDTPRIQRSWTFGSTPKEHYHGLHSSRTDAFSETFRPLRSPADIRRVSDHPLQMLLHVSRGSGLTQFGGLPVTVQAMYPISKAEYEARLAMGSPGDSGTPLPQFSKPTAAGEATMLSNVEATQPDAHLPMNTLAPSEIERSAKTKFSFAKIRAKDRRGTDEPSVPLERP
jgi:hypothetical protein